MHGAPSTAAAGAAGVSPRARPQDACLPDTQALRAPPPVRARDARTAAVVAVRVRGDEAAAGAAWGAPPISQLARSR
jgi:hypothetical protein